MIKALYSPELPTVDALFASPLPPISLIPLSPLSPQETKYPSPLKCRIWNQPGWGIINLPHTYNFLQTYHGIIYSLRYHSVLFLQSTVTILLPSHSSKLPQISVTKEDSGLLGQDTIITRGNRIFPQLNKENYIIKSKENNMLSSIQE